jgi:hypothetical protein
VNLLFSDSWMDRPKNRRLGSTEVRSTLRNCYWSGSNQDLARAIDNHISWAMTPHGAERWDTVYKALQHDEPMARLELAVMLRELGVEI